MKAADSPQGLVRCSARLRAIILQYHSILEPITEGGINDYCNSQWRNLLAVLILLLSSLSALLIWHLDIQLLSLRSCLLFPIYSNNFFQFSILFFLQIVPSFWYFHRLQYFLTLDSNDSSNLYLLAAPYYSNFTLLLIALLFILSKVRVILLDYLMAAYITQQYCYSFP